MQQQLKRGKIWKIQLFESYSNPLYLGLNKFPKVTVASITQIRAMWEKSKHSPSKTTWTSIQTCESPSTQPWKTQRTIWCIKVLRDFNGKGGAPLYSNLSAGSLRIKCLQAHVLIMCITAPTSSQALHSISGMISLWINRQETNGSSNPQRRLTSAPRWFAGASQRQWKAQVIS